MIKLTTVAEIELSYHPVKCFDTPIRSPLEATEAFKKFFPKSTIALKEMAVAMYLNRNNEILGFYKVSSGGISGTVVDIRLILGTALKTASCSLMLCHNHPSGNMKASIQDIELTQKLREGAKMLDIKLLDHIILAPDGRYLSFADEGLL